MKSTILQTMCLCLMVVLVVACTQQQTVKKEVTDTVKENLPLPVNQSPPPFATPLDSTTAVQWAHDWRQDHAAWWANPSNTKPYAFTLPKADFQAVLGEDGVDSVRLYLGLKPGSGKTQEIRLIVVGVDDNGNNLFNYTEGNKAYDLTAICPPICGNQNSPMNAGGQ